VTADLGQHEIEVALRGRLGRPLEFHDAIDSTNARALDWAREGAPGGATVVADHQSAGRGRWGRSWLSRPGSGLLFSIVLRHEVEAPGLLTSALGVGVARGIEDVTGLEATLKWPNDVELGARKVAGILVEAITGQHKVAAVAGIGVNHDWAGEVPEEIADRATSIRAEIDRIAGDLVPTRTELLVSVLYEIEQALARGTAIMDEARRRSSVLGRFVRIRLANGASVQGEATALGDDGTLKLVTDSGSVDVVAGEVERLLPG
jgi:BirA family transcriptional regulator, biotin operon repressor / biotin---[acetyl-CoA-carboxylase] ligase